MIARELIALPPFAEDVAEGLTRRPKTLPPKLFYDHAGSALFEEITGLPEYYLTRTELAILRERSGEIVSAAGPGLSVVELGSGTAAKTCTLLQALARKQMRVPYFPVDISPTALREAQERVEAQCQQCAVRPVVADFADGFGFLRTIPGRKLILYLGSSIGNFDPDVAINFLCAIRRELSSGDALLLGTDLVKDASILLPAYDDALGVTAEFNKNILRRINRELGANFNLDEFRHIARWNAAHSRMEIYLESLRAQSVNVNLLQLTLQLHARERIHTENSYKYTMPMVEAMLSGSGFAIQQTWFDQRKWFALHLAMV